MQLTNRRLKHAEKESSSHQAAKVVPGRHAAEHGAPAEDHDGDELADGEADKTVSDEGLEDELRDVDDGAEPGELVSDEVRIPDETEDGGVGEGVLVEGLQAVNDTGKVC